MRRNAAELVPVEIVVSRHARGATLSSPEPRLRRRWSELRKLRWHAAVVMARHPGVVIYVEKGRSWTNGRFDYGLFSISGHGWGLSATTFQHAWSILSGLEIGLGVAARVRGEVE